MTYTLYAVFDWDSYVAYFYNGTELFGQSNPVIYGNNFNEISNIPSQDESGLELEEKISFKGWTDKQQDNPIVADIEQVQKLIVDVSTIKATEDKKFYAVFLKENVYDSLTDNKYLSFTWNNDENGYYIGMNSQYKLSGKITLPLSYENKPIVGIKLNGFNADSTGHTITHVFWDKNSTS
jgi:hypothetical protein